MASKDVFTGDAGDGVVTTAETSNDENLNPTDEVVLVDGVPYVEPEPSEPEENPEVLPGEPDPQAFVPLPVVKAEDISIDPAATPTTELQRATARLDAQAAYEARVAAKAARKDDKDDRKDDRKAVSEPVFGTASGTTTTTTKVESKEK